MLKFAFEYGPCLGLLLKMANKKSHTFLVRFMTLSSSFTL